MALNEPSMCTALALSGYRIMKPPNMTHADTIFATYCQSTNHISNLNSCHGYERTDDHVQDADMYTDFGEVPQSNWHRPGPVLQADYARVCTIQKQEW